MKHIIVFFLSIWVSISSVLSQVDWSPATFGLEAFSLETKELGVVNYFLTKDQSAAIEKPLLVYLDGSGALPLFQKNGENRFGSTIVLDFKTLSRTYKVLVISKPGVPFLDKVDLDETGFPNYDTPLEYTKRLSLDWRVTSADLIINELINKNRISTEKIVVLGFSEGAQVAPYLAAKNKKVTHLMLFAGNGLNQFFDPIIQARMRATRGEINEQVAQVIIDSLFIQYQNIYAHPKSIEKQWWGHTYKRWASFTTKDPFIVLADLDIPIYIANGSIDENSVLSADYIALEFIRKGKTNLTYKTYPNCDHQFNEIVIEEGKFVEAIPRLDEALSTAFEWLENQ